MKVPLITGAAIAALSAAQADTISQSYSHLAALTDWIDLANFAKFDSNLGTLTGVTITATANIRDLAAITDTSGAPYVSVLDHGIIVGTTGLGLAEDVVLNFRGVWSNQVFPNVASFEGSLFFLFAGLDPFPNTTIFPAEPAPRLIIVNGDPNGNTDLQLQALYSIVPEHATVSPLTDLYTATAGELANFVGPGTFTVPVSSKATATDSTQNSSGSHYYSASDAAITIVYTYTPKPCDSGVIGGVDLGGIINNYLFLFADGSKDANWQGATKGFAGNIAVDGILAKERTSGNVPYAGTIQTSDSTLSAWQQIVNQNAGQAFASYNNAVLINTLKSKLTAAFSQINGLPVTPGYANRSATSLNGLNTQNGIAETFVINIRSGFQVSSQINITGDAGDVFILRWDTDANPANGYQGAVKFQSGGAIVPLGGLTAANFIHVAGDIDSSGGGSTPPPPYPQGPRFNNGQGPLIAGAANFNGGGFFTGYWLTTGDPVTGETHALSNAIFVGGWYTLTTKFSMTSGTSGVFVSPNCP